MQKAVRFIRAIEKTINTSILNAVNSNNRKTDHITQQYIENLRKRLTMPTISIGFNESETEPKNIMISMEVPIMENEHIWVWDHYFSFVLNRLGEKAESAQLIETLTQWSKGFAQNMAIPFEDLAKNNLLTLSQNLQIVSHMEDCQQLYFVEITPQSGHWPNVHIKINDDANPKNLSDSVIALAEFFLNNNRHFYRDLPLHMLAMRKYYQDELSYIDEQSISEAPAYAFDTAYKFYQSLEQAK